MAVSAGGVHGINGGEHLRFYPPNTANFHALYSRRNDSESYHRQIKYRLTRLPAYRANRQSFLLLGMALLNNAATRAFEQQRKGNPTPSTAPASATATTPPHLNKTPTSACL